jgi:hypothetical protein
MSTNTDRTRGAVLTNVLFYGAAWGVVEATLGYLLHLLRRVTPLPGLTGYILFPIGFFLMLAAFRATGRPIVPVLVATVAAGVKLAGVALPQVQWIFVGNPAISIVLEGLVVSAAAAVFRFDRSPAAIPVAVGISVLWRGLFLLAVLVLPVQKGILMKGTAALLSFTLIDSAVNGLLIGGALWAGLSTERLRSAAARLLTPAGVAATLAVAVGAEVAASLL